MRKIISHPRVTQWLLLIYMFRVSFRSLADERGCQIRDSLPTYKVIYRNKKTGDFFVEKYALTSNYYT